VRLIFRTTVFTQRRKGAKKNRKVKQYLVLAQLQGFSAMVKRISNYGTLIKKRGYAGEWLPA